MKKLVACFALASLAGCSLMQRPSQSNQDRALIASATSVATLGCIKLRDSLKDGERLKVKYSLDALSFIMQEAPPGKVIASIGLIDPQVAPFAQAIAGLAIVGADSFTPEARDSVAAEILRGVVDGCREALV